MHRVLYVTFDVLCDGTNLMLIASRICLQHLVRKCLALYYNKYYNIFGTF
jgi:hypothetical protein